MQKFRVLYNMRVCVGWPIDEDKMIWHLQNSSQLHTSNFSEVAVDEISNGEFDVERSKQLQQWQVKS